MHSSVKAQIDTAERHYRLGNLAEAESELRRVLEHDPQQVVALFWLALITDKLGRSSDSIDYYRRVLELRPESGEAHGNLGSVLLNAGQVEAAIDHCRQCLALMSDSAPAHYNLGLALGENDQIEEAIHHFQEAIRLMPEFVIAHHYLGVALCKQKQFETGIAHLQRAIELDPDHVGAHQSLGEAFLLQNRLDGALTQLRHVLTLEPECFTAHHQLGIALEKQGHIEDAIAQFQQAIVIQPGYVPPYINLAGVMLAQYHFAEATAYCQQALRLEPDNANVHNTYACILLEQEKFEEAITHYEQATHAAPDCAEFHTNLGMILLHVGDFQRGCDEYNWRWKAHLIGIRYKDKLWDGANLRGKTILLTAEQGFGDHIQFARYAQLLADRGAEVIIGCPKPLIRVLVTIPGVAQCIDLDKDSVETHCHAPLLELPRILGTTLETIPANVPYVSPPRDSVIDLQTPPNTTLRIGIVWNPNPDSGTFKKRACPLRYFLDLLDIPGITLYSLQKIVSDSDAELLQSSDRIQDLSDQFNDFADTAAAIAQLDLVITVDTSVAHLSGALGQTTWTLLPKVPDWRWLSDREDSPWYPTMRLFRQHQHGNWEEVFVHVTDALKTLLSSDRAVK